MATTSRREVAKTSVTLRIVHTATSASGSAQTPEGCEPAPAGQTDMSVLAVHEHGTGDAETPALDRVLTFTALNARKGSGQFIIGWVPGRGNDRNATATDVVEW